MRLLQRGNKERTQEPTAANKTSSRSHALLIVNVKQSQKVKYGTKGTVKMSRLYMIDLAGSERASQTKVNIHKYTLPHTILGESKETHGAYKKFRCLSFIICVISRLPRKIGTKYFLVIY